MRSLVRLLVLAALFVVTSEAGAADKAAAAKKSGAALEALREARPGLAAPGVARSAARSGDEKEKEGAKEGCGRKLPSKD